LNIKPFLKWAGGKRWIVERDEFKIPQYTGRYIEPFLGGGAVFFHVNPENAILSDLNPRLIETYQAIKDDWQKVWYYLKIHQRKHDKAYYYLTRSSNKTTSHTRAAQFLYLNRACWNGLYRENLKGKFNVPIGTKTKILMDDDCFEEISKRLKNVQLINSDFERVISNAVDGDFLFVDPPYTVAHNFNGFVKYNEKIFSWNDQIRLRDSLFSAKQRGVRLLLTNAHHESVKELYRNGFEYFEIPRRSVISSQNKGRSKTQEALLR
jgi:DNA adenine methylase